MRDPQTPKPTPKPTPAPTPDADSHADPDPERRLRPRFRPPRRRPNRHRHRPTRAARPRRRPTGQVVATAAPCRHVEPAPKGDRQRVGQRDPDVHRDLTADRQPHAVPLASIAAAERIIGRRRVHVRSGRRARCRAEPVHRLVVRDRRRGVPVRLPDPTSARSRCLGRRPAIGRRELRQPRSRARPPPRRPSSPLRVLLSDRSPVRRSAGSSACGSAIAGSASARSRTRSVPSELGRLDRGDEVEILESHQGFLMIRTPDDVTGWIMRHTTISAPPD